MEQEDPKAQMAAQELQLKQQAQQAELGFKQERHQMEMQQKSEKHELEMNKEVSKLEFDAQKAETQSGINMMQARTKAELAVQDASLTRSQKINQILQETADKEAERDRKEGDMVLSQLAKGQEMRQRADDALLNRSIKLSDAAARRKAMSQQAKSKKD